MLVSFFCDPPPTHTCCSFFCPLFPLQKAVNRGLSCVFQETICVKMLLLNSRWKIIVLGWCECPLAFGEVQSLSQSCHWWCSQLISGPGHPAPPFAPVLRRLAPGIPGGCALLLILPPHHTLAVSRPHGFCLLSLLSEGCKIKGVGDVTVSKANDYFLLKSKRYIFLRQ